MDSSVSFCSDVTLQTDLFTSQINAGSLLGHLLSTLCCLAYRWFIRTPSFAKQFQCRIAPYKLGSREASIVFDRLIKWEQQKAKTVWPYVLAWDELRMVWLRGEPWVDIKGCGQAAYGLGRLFSHFWRCFWSTVFANILEKSSCLLFLVTCAFSVTSQMWLSSPESQIFTQLFSPKSFAVLASARPAGLSESSFLSDPRYKGSFTLYM